MRPSNAPPNRVLQDDRGRTYEVVRQLGDGSFGEVVLAMVHEPGGLSLPAAVRLLHRELQPDGAAVRQLVHDTQLLVGLGHPAIRTPTAITHLDGRTALVAEYVEGQDLDTVLYGRVALPPGPVLDIVEQVADALHAAWTEHALVHRDIKPQNIRIGVHGSVQLLDFGIARNELMSTAAEGSLLGTLPYLAPERFHARETFAPSADIFALGCVLFEAWTRTAYYSTLEGNQLLILIDDPATYDPWCDERLASPALDPIRDLLRSMLAYDPDDRPSALAVAERCDALAAQVTPRQTLRRWSRDRRTESDPTERMSAVDAAAWLPEDETDVGFFGPALGPPPLVDDQATDHVPIPVPPDTSTGIEAMTSFRLPEATTAPGPIDPRPASLPIPEVPRTQATTRWIAPAVRRSDRQPDPDTWAVLVVSTVGFAAVGLLFAMAYAAGVFDGLW